jgi:aminobenzoyl-glutamate utilization protein B
MQLFDDPAIIETTKKEFLQIRGENFQYIPLLGDREPALDYRD